MSLLVSPNPLALITMHHVKRWLIQLNDKFNLCGPLRCSCNYFPHIRCLYFYQNLMPCGRHHSPLPITADSSCICGFAVCVSRGMADDMALQVQPSSEMCQPDKPAMLVAMADVVAAGWYGNEMYM